MVGTFIIVMQVEDEFGEGEAEEIAYAMEFFMARELEMHSCENVQIRTFVKVDEERLV